MTTKKISLRQADCLTELRDLATESVDLIVADPPYNLGKDYGNNHDLKGFSEYLQFISLAGSRRACVVGYAREQRSCAGEKIRRRLWV
jgi:DNA modification methylase